MSGDMLSAVFFCLATGAALGCLFLLCKVVRILLHAGRFTTAVLDILFCLLCALTAFLCALALDQGSFRVFQATFQLLGAWAAVAALDPFVSGVARKIHKIFCKVSVFFKKRLAILTSHFHRKKRRPAKKRKKTGKKPKKQKKKT